MAMVSNVGQYQPTPDWRYLAAGTLRFGTTCGCQATTSTVWNPKDFGHEGHDDEQHALSLFDALRLSEFPSKHLGDMPGVLKTEDTQTLWRLVWCHERCHKPASEGFRADVSKAIAPAGGKLVCLRKADQFGAWIARRERPPFVLLSDWREAKPCMRAALQQPPEALPVAVVILCEDARQKNRAREWSAGCSVPVYVQDDIGSPQAFVQELLRLLAAKSASADDRSPAGAPRTRAGARPPPSPRARLLSTPPPSPAQARPEAFAWPLQMPGPVPRGQEAHWDRILKQAMPEAYED